MNNLKTICSNIDSFTQIRKPKPNNIELVALNLTAEYMSTNTELQLFRKIQSTYLENLIEHSVYNKRRKKIYIKSKN